MKKLINYLLQGVLYLAPLTITSYIIYTVFMFMDGLLQEYVELFFDVKIPGLGFLTLVIFLIFIGFIGKTIIANPLKVIFQNILKKIPLLNFVYTAVKDLFSAFVGKEKKFDKPVLVKMSGNTELEKLGFITEENLEILNELDKVAVYFPHSYNFSGELYIAPKANIKRLEVNSSEMMKFIVSAGLSSWDTSKKIKA